MVAYVMRKFRREPRRAALIETDGFPVSDGRAGYKGHWRSPGKRATPRKGFSNEPPESFFTRTGPGRKLRRESFVNVEGTGKSIAVLTSGGDAQGMNAAIRAVARLAIYSGAKAYAVYWGYQGLVDGGDNIKELEWQSVTGITHLGGTVIGSARCIDFRSREGRRQAAFNLVTRGITNLVIIGGDGSLTGANEFRQEWPELLKELVEEGRIKAGEAVLHGHLNIVGMVGSIDNDFCGTDMTIGADSALHRIVESVDAISTTAESHQRAFVLEVMGRHCGYLALVAGISVGADWIFIPEWPVEDDWQDNLCTQLRKGRENGRLLSIIILAEGAQNIHGEPVTANQVKDLICKNLGYDTRVTVLGHVQRGGAPSAFDRLLAMRLGAEAALTVLEDVKDMPPQVVCLDGNQIVKKNLMENVEKCNAIKKAYAEKDFKKVVELRGASFKRNLAAYKVLKLFDPTQCNTDGTCKMGYTLAVMNVGAPAGGMNPATKACVRSALNQGHSVLAISDGFDGLIKGQVRLLGWNDVDKWSNLGGSNLGVTRTLPSKAGLAAVNDRLSEFGIQGLLIVGGFEAFNSALELAKGRERQKAFRIPIIVIPATMSNNVPGTHFSLGADTTLNVIVESCDRIRQSASSSQDRVFVVETMGGRCGYLATMAGIAAAADAAYIREEPFGVYELLADANHLMYKFQNTGIKRGLVLRAQEANERYTTKFITSLYEEEAKGVFITRESVLGHLQQEYDNFPTLEIRQHLDFDLLCRPPGYRGGPPSPFDRLNGTRQAMKAVRFLIENIGENIDENGIVSATSPNTACVLCHVRAQTLFRPVVELEAEADMK
eukprot:gene8053-13967_t